MAFDRNTSIKSAMERGRPIEVVKQGLAKEGMEPLSSYEETLYKEGRFGTNVFQRAGMDALEKGRGISTLGGLAKQYLSDEDTRNTINQAIVQGAVEKGKRLTDTNQPLLERVEKEITAPTANFFLSPYGITIEDVVTDLPKAARTAGEMTVAHPLNILDFLPAGKIGGISKKAGDVVTETAKKATKDIPIVKDIRAAILPTAKETEINKILNLSEAPYAKRLQETVDVTNKLEDSGKLQDAITNLMTGTVKEGTEDITQQVKDFTKKFDDELKRLGVDPEANRKEATATYILNKLDPDRKVGTRVDLIKNALTEPTKENLDLLGVTKEQLLSLKDEADNLFNQDLITTITNRGIKTNRTDNLLQEAEKYSLGISRKAGDATPQEVAENFVRGYTKLQKEINRIDSSFDTLDELSQKFGKKITPDEASKIAKNELIISPTEFKDMAKQLYFLGDEAKLGEKTTDFLKGKGTNLQKYANDLYVLDKSDLEAWARKGTGTKPYTPVLDALGIPASMMKQSVLAKPSYFVQNRLGNWYLNLMGGGDYPKMWERIAKGKLMEDIPEYLTTSSSYFGLNPSMFKEGFTESTRRILKDIQQSSKEFKDRPFTSTGEILRDIQKIPTQAIFKPESTFETLDRAAAYYGAANRYARRSGQKLDDVLKQAKDNPRLERELIQEVNNTLGDYVGRNYYIDPRVRKALDVAIPFNKIITTSAQILPRNARDNWLQYQLMFRKPAEFGNELYEYQNLQEAPDIRGGLVTSPAPYQGGPTQVTYNEAVPFTAPLEYVSMLAPSKESLMEKIGNRGYTNLSYATGIMNAIQGKDRFGNPVVGPNSYKVNGKTYTLDNNGNATEVRPDVVGGIAGYLGQNVLPIATLANQFILPTVGELTQQNYADPTNRSIFGQVGNISIPYLMEGKTDKPTRDDLLWRNLGFKTRESYPEYTPRIDKRIMKQILRQQRKREMLKKTREGDR